MYFKSKKELNDDRFVDPNILGAARLVHSDLSNFVLLDKSEVMPGRTNTGAAALQA